MTLPAPPLLFLHGAWHQGSCWALVAECLRARGHTVLTPDLPGYDAGPEALRRISLRTYVDAVLDLLDSLDAPACVIAHSMAGMVLAQCSSERPERIREALYLCAYLPSDGDSLFTLIARNRGAAAPTAIEQAMHLSPDKRTCTVDPTLAGDLFYTLATAEQKRNAVLALGTQPTLPLAAKVSLDIETFARVRRTYVCCTQDRVIPPAHQQRMLIRQPCQRLLRIDTDHSPFLSAPRLLADLIEASI